MTRSFGLDFDIVFGYDFLPHTPDNQVADHGRLAERFF